MSLRYHKEVEVLFANGGTVGLQQVPMHNYAFGIVHVPSEFNGDTLSFRSVSSTNGWGVNTVLTKTVATGANPFTAEEIAKIGGIGLLQIETSVAVSAAAKLWLELKT